MGVPVVVAAGNENEDVKNSSPARVKQAITVAASTIDDTKASFSNFGTGVDVWAPGLNVISTSNNGSTKVLSGTSMATPHVAGLVAYLLGLDSSLSPAEVENTIKSKAISDAISGVREYHFTCPLVSLALQALRLTPLFQLQELLISWSTTLSDPRNPSHAQTNTQS